MSKSAIIGSLKRPWIGCVVTVAGALLGEFAVAVPAHSGDFGYEPYPVAHRYAPDRWHRRHVVDHRYVVNEYYTNYTTPWHPSYPQGYYDGWRRPPYYPGYHRHSHYSGYPGGGYGYPGPCGYPCGRPFHSSYPGPYGSPGPWEFGGPRPYLGYGGVARPAPISYEYEPPPQPSYEYEMPPRPPVGIPAGYYGGGYE